MLRSIWATYSERNARILLLLGFASGLPLALTSGTLQAWITVENVDIRTIGFFTLVSQAYVFKFLWAPFMDRYQLPFLGRRRGWMIATQLLLVVSIAGMGMLKPTEHLWWLAAAAAIVAFCSASQDIIFDAYKTDLLSAKDRGTGAAISTLGYRLAMLLSGGLALFIAHRYTGWQNMYLLMAGMMLIGVFATLRAKEPETDAPPPRTLREAVREPLAEFFSRNNTWLLLLLIVLYKMGDAFALTLSTPFLIRGAGFGPDEVGLINKTLGLAATIVGALYGGYLMQRWSLFKSLMFFGILQGFSNLGYWVLSVTPQNIYMMGGVVFIENICGGMGTAAFVALLMTLCNRSFSATQFALLSATVCCRPRLYRPVCRLDGGGLRLELVLSVHRVCRNSGIAAADVVPQNAAIHPENGAVSAEAALPQRLPDGDVTARYHRSTVRSQPDPAADRGI